MMESTKEHPSPFDGLEKAEPDEPVFPLRAHDPLAAPLVHEWVRLRRENVPVDVSEDKRAGYLIQTTAAEEVAWAMEGWRRNETEAPAPVREEPRSYSGNSMDARELEAKRIFDRHKEAAQHLRNAAAEIVDCRSIMIDLEGHRFADLEDLIQRVNGWADDIQPKRTSYAHKGNINDPI